MSSHRRLLAVQAIKAKADSKRGKAEKFADWMTNNVGTTIFLVANTVFFGLWIIINLKMLSGVEPFDPFPFNFLTMVVSLEAIILSIIVLISQNRASRVGDIREEIDLQVNMITESEITKIMELVVKLVEKQGIDISRDKELQEMLKPLKEESIEEEIAKQLSV